ncbi:MAG: ATP-binding protein [Pirellulaceae bacterium]|nr:ATP-binding protein [Pirellulaceae bacterium]
MTPPDVQILYLAGGFGFHMDVENVIRCGLLPGFRPEQISLVGNTSLAGAYLALLDSSVLDEIKRISAQLETIELNLVPGFESCYIDQLAVMG